MKTSTIILFLNLSMIFYLQAADYRGEEAVRIGAGDSLFTDLFAGARSVDIFGYVDSDVYAACQRITIEGEVAEDVLTFCQELSIRGKVGDMVSGFAKSILIDGQVGGDVHAFGGDVRITERAHIKGNLFVGTGNFRFEGGRVDGWIRGGAGKVYLNGSVGRQLELEVLDKVRFGVDYHAAQGTELTLKKDLDRATAENLPEDLEIIIKERPAFYRSGFLYWSFISMLIFGILIMMVFKNFSRVLLSYAADNIVRNSGIGLLYLLITPLIIIILLLLVVTIPVALILLALYLILLYLSSILTALYVGNYVMTVVREEKSPNKLILPLLVGLLFVVLLPKLPFIGWLVGLAIVCFGGGSIIAYLWSLKKIAAKAA